MVLVVLSFSFVRGRNMVVPFASSHAHDHGRVCSFL